MRGEPSGQAPQERKIPRDEYGDPTYRITSHLVKYSHHVDGRAHFSQGGKILTAIKRQSMALDKQYGHIFSLLVQGLNAVDPAKDELQSTKRAVIAT